MGVIKRGILGGFSNKVANVVGSSWKGIAYMRAMPLSVANPRTAGQVNQRTRFGTISAFASGIVGGWIQPLWNRFAVQASGFNDFVRVNIDYVANNGIIAYADLKMSSGKLINVTNIAIVGAITAGNSGSDIEWVDNTGQGNALATDDVYAVGYNVGQDKWSTVGVEQRDESSVRVNFEDPYESGDVVYFWIATRRADGTIVSNSFDVTGTAA